MLFLGRTDRQVQIEGHRVEPAELEAVAARLTGCSVAALTIKNEEFDGERLVLLIESANALLINLHDELKAHLPAHLLPTVIKCLPEFPRTPSNEINTMALRGLFLKEE